MEEMMEDKTGTMESRWGNIQTSPFLSTQHKSVDFLTKLDAAVQVLMVAWEDHHASDIADALDALSEYRAQYVKDNSQFGVGA